MQIQDGATWLAVADIKKWNWTDLKRAGVAHLVEQKEHGVPGLTGEELLALDIHPSEELTVVGNLLTNAGLTRLNNLLTGAGGTAFNSTNSRIGTGNSATVAAVTDTDLGAAAGSANRWFQLVSGVPGVSNGVTTFTATFGTADGNYVWNEWGIDNGTASGNTVTAPLLNHKIASMGTKASGASWTITATITIA